MTVATYPANRKLSFIVALATILSLLLPISCAPHKQENAKPLEPQRDVPTHVSMVCIDAATWPVFDELMDAGLMPHLQRIVATGARGTLKSFNPTASAVIWTSIATGKVPEKHGIKSFIARNGQGKVVPVTSNMRRVKAIWNMASESGVRVGILGWWASWPAEPVRGFLCSDYTWPLKKSDRGFATGVDLRLKRDYRTYPDSLQRELDRFIKTQARMSKKEMTKLELNHIPISRGYALREILLKDISYGEMTPYLIDKYKPSLFSVYFEGFDAFCHHHWKIYSRFLRSRVRGEAASEDMHPRARRVCQAFDAHIARLDKYIGEILHRVGPDDVIMVISDHGYGDNPAGKPIMRGYGEFIHPPDWHTLNGIIALQGGPIKKGVRLSDCSVLDVAPTVLALLGLPVGRDFDGKPILAALTDEFKAKHPIQWIDTWDKEGPRQGQGPEESPYDEEMKKRLRSLGYLD